MIRLVLFDIDGTLIRTGGAGVKAFDRTFDREFALAGATRELNFSGRTDWSLVRECFRKHGIEPSPENFHRFFDHYVFWLDKLLGCLDGGVCPGVWQFIESIQGLQKPPVLALLTGNIRLGAEIKLRHYGLWEIFRLGAFGDDHEDRNQLASVALARGSKFINHDLMGEEVLVIGDTPLDIACGQTIGAKVLAVGTGAFSPAQLEAFNPTWAIPNLRDCSAEDYCG